jgi:peptidoglycan biosynthesis protein MviN/MurJ (putative lipid II flippase)
MYTIISRYFYAQKNTRTPLLVSLLAIGSNIFLAYNLSKPSAYGVTGLAIAQSTVAAGEVFILFAIMLKNDRKLFDLPFWSGILRIISVTGFSALVAFLLVGLMPLNVNDRGLILMIKLTLIGCGTLLTHVVLSWAIGLKEVQPIFEKIRKLVLKPVKIQ